MDEEELNNFKKYEDLDKETLILMLKEKEEKC